MMMDNDLVKMVLQTLYDKDFGTLTKDISLNPIVSYTTRPIRSNETDGIEHYFITNEEADILLSSNEVLAYTKIGDNRYFTLVNQIGDQNVYVIDPNGIDDLRENHPDINIKVISIRSDYNTRKTRFINRDDNTTEEDFLKREEAEALQFNRFEINRANYDYSVFNNSPYIATVLIDIAKFIRKTYTKDTLYCFVGRTSSGKDTIVKLLCDLFKKKNKEEE